MEYRFDKGDCVRIRSSTTSSTGVKTHANKVVTIKRRCPFTWAYELVELAGLWQDCCFEKAQERK